MRFILFSDAHFHIWGNYNEGNRRVQAQMQAIEKLFYIANQSKAPLVFTGDMFHDPEGISNELWSIFQPWFMELFNRYPVNLYAISGNHDMKETNTFRKRSPSYINTLANSIKNFHNLDFESVDLGDYVLHGVPYITHNEGIMEVVRGFKLSPKKKNILLLHTDFKGQKDTGGMEVGKGANIEEDYLSKFDLVLSGHIHKPGKIRGNIYSIGAPYQLRVSDMGGSFGYWICRDNFKMSFKPLEDLPEFRYYTRLEEVDKFHYWVKKPIEDTEALKEVKVLNLEDKQQVVIDFLKATEEKSKSRKIYLINLIKRIKSNEEGNL